MVKVIRYSFEGWKRADSSPLNAVRPRGVIYYTLSPEAGGERVEASVVEETTLEALLDTGVVWAGDAYLADLALRWVPHPEWRVESIRDYASSIKLLSEPEVPDYRHLLDIRCGCGCERSDGETNYNYVEFMFLPSKREKTKKAKAKAKPKQDRFAPYTLSLSKRR